MPDHLNILFVEDEPDIRSIVNIALSLDIEIDVTAYSNGMEALSAIIESRKVFDLALLDGKMPYMGGVELHKHLRRIPGLQTLRSAIITASVRSHELEYYKVEGVVGVIPKPFDPILLASKIRALATMPIEHEMRFIPPSIYHIVNAFICCSTIL